MNRSQLVQFLKDNRFWIGRKSLSVVWSIAEDRWELYEWVPDKMKLLSSHSNLNDALQVLLETEKEDTHGGQAKTKTSP